MATEVMLTTFDNPYNPFDDFDSWLMFDIEKGYNSCSRLARVARHSEEFSTVEDRMETVRAIDAIIDNDILCVYTKVTREVEDDIYDGDNEDEDE